MFFIGIDPGVSGGIACVTDAGNALAVKMPATDRDVLDAIKAFVRTATVAGDTAKAVLERVSSSPQMGVVSAFTFGRGVGALRMALTAAKVPFDEVTPQKWQKATGCLTGGDKNISKRRAQQLFPSITVTHAIADALLLAEYCRRVERGSGNDQREVQRDGKEEGSGAAQGHTETAAQGSRTVQGGRRAGKAHAQAQRPR